MSCKILDHPAGTFFPARPDIAGCPSFAKFSVVLVLWLACADSSAMGQSNSFATTPGGYFAGAQQPAFAESGLHGAADTSSTALDSRVAPCGAACQGGKSCASGCQSGCNSHWFGGADFLLVRPHFSEAVAFARGTQSPTFFGTEADELQFGYDASFRAHAGYDLGCGAGEIRFTYWNLEGDTAVNGSVGGPGQFIVDPFGNIVGAVAIINPADPRFGTVVTGGDEIRTRASVETNIYDLDFTRELCARSRCWEIELSFGVRVADIDQFYDSVVTTTGGALVGQGEFAAEFIGAGPRLGLLGRQYFGGNRRFSLFASCHGALLLGQYDVRADTTPTPGFQTSQVESLTRSVPVLDTELGAIWRFNDSVQIHLGWLFQAWFDMGTSGGTFGGFFAGADDANVMSFDGMFLRAEILY